MNLYEIVVFLGWFAGLWGTINASIQKSSAFESVGTSKSKWIVINVLGLIIPYLGLVTASIYASRVYRKLPTRSRKIRQLYSQTRSQSMMDQHPEGYSSPPQETGFAAATPRPAKSSRIPCSACGASGQVNSGQVCFPCGGKGYV
jgi:hypothetical protein